MNAWNGLPHFVSFGNQKNFQFFMQSLKDDFPDGFVPDEACYRSFIAKAILFRSVQKLVRTAKVEAPRIVNSKVTGMKAGQLFAGRPAIFMG